MPREQERQGRVQAVAPRAGPRLDYATLTRDLLARRTNPLDPDRSLILLKATAQSPTKAGSAFRTDSREYAILRQWIEADTPLGCRQRPLPW